MDKFVEIKNEYNDFVLLLKEKLDNIEQETILNYFLAAILKIWGSNSLYSPDYAVLISSISGRNYTLEQVLTAMSCCGDCERKIAIPDFFVEIIKTDIDEKNVFVSDVINKINDILVAAAIVNGDFTLEEANCLSSIISDLINFAYVNGIERLSKPDYSNKITAKNEDSYLQNDALLVAVRNENKKLHNNYSDDNQQESSASVTININVVPDNQKKDDVNLLDEQSVPSDVKPSVTEPVADDEETMESLLAELDSLVGLENVKQDVHSLINFIKVTKIREGRGMKVPAISYHLVFTGNPGTGKTTVARLVAKLYYHMGILPQGQLVETDRSALVAGYLGQTAIKTQKVIQQAMGGVLFIDEAYSLAGETDDSYGKEAVETILKAMEDHRDELVVIVAGYTELMHKFIESNPGLSSRFSKYFEYADYNGDELIAIFKRFCDKNGYVLCQEAQALLKQKFDQLYANRDEHFGNARTARNIFEKTINAQADRLAVQSDISDEDLINITLSDVFVAIGGSEK